jgi:hypothetical protein
MRRDAIPETPNRDILELAMRRPCPTHKEEDGFRCDQCFIRDALRYLHWLMSHATWLQKECNRCHKSKPVISSRDSPIGLICQTCYETVDWTRVEGLDKEIEAGEKNLAETRKIRELIVKGEVL